MPSTARNLLLRNGVWYARIQINGRDVWRSLRTADEREARKRLKEVRRQAELERAGLTPPPPPPPEEIRLWEDAVVRWSQTHLPGKRDSTAKRYLTSLAKVEAHLKGRPLAGITQAVLNDYVAERLEDGVTPATVRRDLTAVSLVWRAAKRAGWVRGENPALAELEEIKELREPIRPVRLRDLALLLRRCPPAFAALIRFLARTGCRQEEGASLEWQDVDLARGTVTFARTKTRSPRVIRLSPRTVAMLRALPRHPRLTYVFWHPGGKHGPDRFRNVASNFRELVTRGLRSGATGAEGDGFRRCGPAAFRPFRCHDLRHTWGIRALQRGMPIFDVSRHLGHATVQTTEGYVRWLRQAPG
ncbi:integrase [Caldovatus sediminis]|uniref:Integrase n=1 Tax=Caldovatus sediminis TaxID=2041189 RepID=A0A8J3EEB8_9PROT|nr:site-specific integrase [Caldovatus sediminis]GGG51367.1 integrase [Caldovatus sediminis]